MKISNTNDKVASLFSGAGGFSLGFAQAGLKPGFAIDIDSDACRTYQENFGIQPFNEDISNLSEKAILSLEEYKNCFAIIGGPPCQGFSTAGSRNANDARNKLIFSYLNIVKYIKPRWFIFENVEGLLTSGNGSSIEGLVKEFVSMGYTLRVEKVNFAAYGLPQGRKRVLIVGNSCGTNFNFPQLSHSFSSGKHNSLNSLPTAPTLGDALAGLSLESLSKGQTANYAKVSPVNGYDAQMRKGNTSNKVTLHTSVESSSQQQAINILKPGQSMKDLPEEYWHDSFKRRAFRRVKDGTPTEKRGGAPSGIKRLRNDLCALTITSASPREFIHPISNRPLTLRECIRLQSFPDRFQFVGGTTSIGKQIGNAVPPMAAEVIAEHLKCIDGQAGADVGNIVSVQPGLLGYHLTDAAAMSPALERTNQKLGAISPIQYELAL